MTIKTAALALSAASVLSAAGTTAWEMNSYPDFIKGRFTGMSLSRDGRIMLAPKLEQVLASNQPAIWSIARRGDGTIYAATGHKGVIYQIDPAGVSSVFWAAPEPEVFALALNAKGELFAATSPDGKVYRVQKGHATEYFAPAMKYIWALAFDSAGFLYAGTDQGRVYRVAAQGKGEIYYDTGQSHITCLAFDPQDRLLAGSEPNGILYRITAKDKAFVLYDSNLPEIHSIVVGADGAIYAAALGGSLASRAAAATSAIQGSGAQPQVTAPVTSITVTDDAQAGIDIKPKAEQPKPAATPQVSAQITPLIDMSGVEKSAVYRIQPDNTVETLWSSKEENAYGLVAVGDYLAIATDTQGRVYRLSADRKVTLLTQTNEGEALALARDGTSLLVATSNAGKLYRIGDGWTESGKYEAPVHDSSTVARWGRLHWRAEMCAGCAARFETRSGNSARPDRTWSDWTAVGGEGLIQSPNARFLQWRLEMSASRGDSPVIDRVSAAYLPQNTPPVVRSITVTSYNTGATTAGKPAASASAAQTAAFSITVTDTGDAGPATSAGTPPQTLSRTGGQQMLVSWQADDPDGDKLVYTLYFRGETEREWKLLRANMPENSLNLDSDILADGRYLFRVMASDRLANTPAATRTAELISTPVLIDNTPPLLTPGEPKRNGGVVDLTVDAADAASPVRRAEYSVDAGTWTPAEAADGVLDSLKEQLLIHVEGLGPGEHLIVIRAYDSAGNAGLAKVVVR